MGAPIQVVEPEFKDDDTRLRWEHDQQMWLTLNSEVKGHPKFTALTIKGGYVIGTIFLIAESIAWLRQLDSDVSFLPRYLLTATIVELLGRCVSGETNPKQPTLRKGLSWLLNSDETLVTSVGMYTVDDLADMRNFCAHGQATSKGQAAKRFLDVDHELATSLLVTLSKRLDHYWNALTDEGTNAGLSGSLACARIDPVNATRIFEAWSQFQKPPYRSVGTIFAAIVNLRN